MTGTGSQTILALGVTAFAVALSGAMAPGPYLTVTISRTLQRGRLSAALMLVGHAALEGVLLIGLAFGLQSVLADSVVRRVIAFAGGVVLLWMGAGMLRGALKGTLSTSGAQDARLSPLGPVIQGALVSLSNPYWTLWWATIGLKLATDGIAMGPLGVAAFFIGHELGDLAWYLTVIFAVSKGRHLLGDRPYRAIIGVCAVFLLFLGGGFALSGVGLV